MAFFFFGVHLLGHNGQDNGEALSSDDGETRLFVRAEKHVVTDGIEFPVIDGTKIQVSQNKDKYFFINPKK